MSMFNIQDHWYQHQIKKRDEEGPKPTAFNTPLRVSDAGACIRKRTFAAHKAAESEEFSSQTFMAFEIGNAIHESIQEALGTHAGEWEFEAEVPIDLTAASAKVGHGIEWFGLSGHCDGIITDPHHGTRTILEIKTVSGYAAKLAWKDGPKREHTAQAGLYCIGAEADGILIVYVAKEGDWRAGIKAGDVMQWEFGLNEIVSDHPYGHTVYDIALDELRHFQYASRYYHKGQLAPAFVPNDHGELVLVHDRPEYMQKGGKPWQCVYCNYNTTCRSLSEDEVPVKMIERINQ